MAPSATSSSPDHVLVRAADFTRRDPAKAVATAFAFGFLLHLLTLGAITSMLVSLLVALVRPVLLLLGVLKALDLARVRLSSDHSEDH